MVVKQMTTFTTRKKIAIVLFITALVFAIPPGVFGEAFTDIFLNLPLATFLSEKFNWSMPFSLIFTYTVLPLALLYLGSIIYPADTWNTMKRQYNKAKNAILNYIQLLKSDPIHIIWLIIIIYLMYIMYSYYQVQINEYLLT